MSQPFFYAILDFTQLRLAGLHLKPLRYVLRIIITYFMKSARLRNI